MIRESRNRVWIALGMGLLAACAPVAAWTEGATEGATEGTTEGTTEGATEGATPEARAEAPAELARAVAIETHDPFDPVTPRAKVGTFELDRLYGDTSDLGAQFRLAGLPIAPGTSKEVGIGSYGLSVGTSAFADGIMPAQQRTIVIKEGERTTQEIAGLRIRYSRPVTLGGSSVRVWRRAGGSAGSLFVRGAWSRRGTGTGMMLLPDEIGLSNDAEATRYLTLPAGRTTEIVLPTVEIRPSLDSYDARFPDYSSCESVKFLAGSNSAGSRESRSVRNRDGSAAEAVVAPAGANASVILRVYGMEFVYPTEGESTIWLSLGRVEVDDMEIPGPCCGSPVRIAGTYRIERKKEDGTWAALSCTLKTRTGVDLPSGTYRITVQARPPTGGTLTDVQEVTVY